MLPKNQISVHRRIAEAVTLRLQYDFLCFKGNMMNESYLIHTVAEILISFFGSQEYEIHTGFIHPILGIQAPSKVGRKPEIDFVVTRRGKTEIEHAIELKWAGSSHCDFDNILWDLTRLYFVKQAAPTGSCALLIAGYSSNFKKLFNGKYLKQGTQHPFAQSPSKAKNFSLTANLNHQTKINKLIYSWQQDYPNLVFPDLISTHLIDPRFSAPEESRFSSKIWTLI
jgi:hypothetical protein